MDFSLGSYVLGILTGGILFFAVHRALHHYFGAIWYQAVHIGPEKEPGVWLCDFCLEGNEKSVYHGYIKKLPPKNVDIKDIEVMIKHFNGERGLMHVFWRIKEV